MSQGMDNLKRRMIQKHMDTCADIKKERQMGHRTQPGADPPPGRLSLAPLSQLEPISVAQLEPGFVHEGRFLLVHVLVNPFRLRAVTAVVEDEHGHAVLLCIYGLANTKERLDDASEYLPKNTVLAIKEPHYKLPDSGEGRAFIRVEHPSDLVRITQRDDPLLNGWAPACRWPGLQADTTSPPVLHTAVDLKSRGNALFQRKSFVDALHMYQRALQLLDSTAQQQQDGESDGPDAGAPAAQQQQQQQLRIDLLSNSAAACLALGTPEAATAAAAFARRAIQAAKPAGHPKSMWREGQALLALGRYSEAADALASLLKAFPDVPGAKDIAASIKAAKGWAREQLGHYDMSLLLLEASKDAGRGKEDGVSRARLKHADFVGPVRVERLAGRGRGLVAARVVKPGELLMAVKADAICFIEEVGNVGVQAMFATSRSPGGYNSPTQASLVRTLQPLVLGAGSLARRLALLSCSSTGDLAGGAQDSSPATIQALCAPLTIPGPADSPMGSIDPLARRAWVQAHPGLFEVTSQGFVKANESTISMVVAHNAFKPESSPGMKVNAAQKSLVAPDSDALSATGLYWLPSLINHSCVNNASRLFVGDFMFIRAREAIPTGQELTLCYTDPLVPLTDRAEMLSRGFGFVCDCKLCAEQKRQDPRVEHVLAMFEAMRPTLRSCPQMKPHDQRRLEQQLSGHLEQLRTMTHGKNWATSVFIVASGLGFVRMVQGDLKGAVDAYSQAFHGVCASSTGTCLNDDVAVMSAVQLAGLCSQIGGRYQAKAKEWLAKAHRIWDTAHGPSTQSLFNAKYQEALHAAGLPARK